jgi:hypothetical protein
MNDFRSLLQKAKQNVQERPETKVDVKLPKLEDFQRTAFALPSEIKISKPKVVEKQYSKSDSQDKPKKPSKITSFKKLMQLAKTVKPEGLIRDVSTVEVARPQRKLTAQSETPKKNNTRQLYNLKSSIKGANSRQKALPHTRPETHKVIIDGKGRLNGRTGVSTELIKLNTVKRDLATIEEIEDERRLKKLKGSAGEVRVGKASGIIPTSSTPKIPLYTSSARSLPLKPISRKDRTISKTQVHNDYSSIISKMFGYDRSRYRDESSDDDMEVNYRDLEKEERRRYAFFIQRQNCET